MAKAWKGGEAAIVNRRDTDEETRENCASNMIRLEQGRRTGAPFDEIRRATV